MSRCKRKVNLHEIFVHIKINNPCNSPLAGGPEGWQRFPIRQDADAIWEKTSGTNQRWNLFPDFTLVWCYILRRSSSCFGNFILWLKGSASSLFVWGPFFIRHSQTYLIDVVRECLLSLIFCVKFDRFTWNGNLFSLKGGGLCSRGNSLWLEIAWRIYLYFHFLLLLLCNKTLLCDWYYKGFLMMHSGLVVFFGPALHWLIYSLDRLFASRRMINFAFTLSKLVY